MNSSSLGHHFFTMACNNAWANLRLLRVCCLLSQEEFAASRAGFFPSIKHTLNHILTVDWFYVDALERGLSEREAHPRIQDFFTPEQPFGECESLMTAQRAVDARLLAVCKGLGEEQLAKPVSLLRQTGLQTESVTRLLGHLFQHQIHHRGQVHAMLASTRVSPPQLDEFFCAGEAHLRAAELAEIGLAEQEIWGTEASGYTR